MTQPLDKPSNQTALSDHHYATICISDVHLGFRDCKADFLNDFLTSTSSDTLFLIGDIIDLWSLKKRFFWDVSHYETLKIIKQKAESGTQVIYIPGNHDDTFRQYVDCTMFGIDIHRSYIHRTSDGSRYLLVHGDEFDHATRYSKFIKIIGDSAYDLLLFLNRWTYRIRKLYGGQYWSLSSYIKNKVSKARNAIDAFEKAAIHEARRRGVDGIICGHIHQPEIRREGHILYCNDGDWVENCTALVENEEGQFELLHWADAKHTLKSNSKKTPTYSAISYPDSQRHKVAS